MGQGSNRIYNVISLLFLVLTLIAGGLVIGRMGQPPAGTPAPVAQVPTLAFLPTFTPVPPTDTFTPVPPTFTPTRTETPSVTPTFTNSVTSTWTLIPTRSLTPTVATNTPVDTLSPSLTYTLTPSLTITFTLTPSNTVPVSNTPTQTNTPINFTPQPTEPPPSPFPFSLRGGQPPTLTINFANSAGCSWQGIGGQVTDQTGLHIGGVRVHVYGSGIDTSTMSGSNTLYGPSGWEVPLSNVVNTNLYYIELLSQGGTIISETVQVQFPGICQQNLALVNFAQTRPF